MPPILPSEQEKKTEMLLSDKEYRLPPNVTPLARASIQARIDQRENNSTIVPPSFGYGHARDRAKKSPAHGGKKSRRKLHKSRRSKNYSRNYKR
jgi:hypothetical protein